MALVQRSRERLLTFGKSGEFFASSRDLWAVSRFGSVISEGLFFISEASRPLRKQFFEPWNDDGIDDHGAGSFELRDGFEHLGDFAEVFRARLSVVAHRLAEDTDAFPRKPLGREIVYTVRYMTDTLLP